LQVGDTGPVESARRSNSRVLGSPFSGLSGHILRTGNRQDKKIIIPIIKPCSYIYDNNKVLQILH
jgi:hypothetical protein